MNKIILYIATSQDGFIADKNNSIDWLPQLKDDAELEAVGYNALISRIDTIVMGNTSFKQIMTFGDWAWPEKQTYVFSYEPLQTPLACITATNQSPKEFVAQIKKRSTGKDVWLLGGAQLAQSFAAEGLIDELILTIVPQCIGQGIPLGVPFDAFKLIEEKKLMDGMIQDYYAKKYK